MRVRIVGEDGAPLAKASLFANIFDIDRLGSFPNVTLETDEQGEVDIALPNKLGLLRLWPSMPGYVPQFLNFGNGNQDPIESLPGSLTFYLERGERLSGTVVDSAGQPIAGASVQVRVDVPESRILGSAEPTINTWLASGDDAVITDQKGAWEILNAPGKKEGKDYKFRLQVTHPDFAGDTRWGELQAKQGVTTEELRAGTAQIKLDPGLRIRGNITGPDGEPITKGLVIWDDRPYWAEGDNEVSIDERGGYRSLPLSPDKYPVTVLAPGFSPQQVNVDLGKLSEDLDFELQTGNRLVLEIVDQDGHPIPDVSVGIGEWRGTEAIYNYKHPNVPESGIPRKSDSDGIYRWDWAPEDAVVYCLGKKGFVNIEVALVARDQPHRIVLSPRMKIFGSVTDKQTGEPIKKFSVVPAKAFSPDFYSTSFQDRREATDGKYEIPVESHGQTGNRYMVRIEADGYRTAFGTKSMEVGDPPLQEDFELEPAAPIDAEVVNPDGTRAFDFMVAVGTPTTAPQFRIERPDSSFGIAMKVTGSCRFQLPATFEPQLVRVFNDRGFAEIDLPIDGTLGKIQLQPWARITGRLMQGDKPISNESVKFHPLIKRGLTEPRFQDSFFAKTDPDGHFEFDRLPPLAGRIQAYLGPWRDSPMTSSQSIPVNLKPGDTKSLSLGSEGGRVVGKVVATGRDNHGLSKQWSINFLVSRAPGLPLLDGDKMLSIAADQVVDQVVNQAIVQSDDFSEWLGTKLHYYVKLSEDGTLQIDGVPPGQYDLVIQLYEQPAGCLVETIGQAIVPVSIESEASTEDLAEINVECRSGPRVGSDMRAFKFIDTESRERNIYEMKDQYVLFHVWASWCAPCIATMPNVKSATSSYKNKPLTIVGLNVDDIAQQAKAKS
ncbi:MAG: redoxin domain-containing protein, partial [Rubripirellula sp.]